MLRDSDLGKDLWGEALSVHIYIHNRCPSRILPGNSTPYEKVFGHAPSIRHAYSDLNVSSRSWMKSGQNWTTKQKNADSSGLKETPST